MFRKTNKDEPQAVVKKPSSPTIIATDMNVLGNIISEGVVDFDGKLDGNIKCHVLHVRPNAVIRGEVTADEIFVYGNIQGTINARAVTLHSGAYVDGIVMHETITIEDGATMDGKLKKTNKPEPSSFADTNYEPVEPISPAKLMENIRLIASNS